MTDNSSVVTVLATRGLAKYLWKKDKWNGFSGVDWITMMDDDDDDDDDVKTDRQLLIHLYNGVYYTLSRGAFRRCPSSILYRPTAGGGCSAAAVGQLFRRIPFHSCEWFVRGRVLPCR